MDLLERNPKPNESPREEPKAHPVVSQSLGIRRLPRAPAGGLKDPQNPKTLNPKPQTLNPKPPKKPYNWNPKPQNPKTLNPKPPQDP